MDYDWDLQLENPGLASSELTNGLACTGQRALFYATGMDEEGMKKPFMAVINSFSEMVPGHMHMRELAGQVKYGILEGGGILHETGTIVICDGLCQGHCGMRYSLPSRDLITDSIEMVVQAHHFDAMVLILGCGKIIPGMLMVAARLDTPAIVVTGGPMLPGNVDDNPLFCSSELRESLGRIEQGSYTVEEMKKAKEAALSTVESCAHLGTANSTCMLTEVLGMSLSGCGTAPAVSNRRKRIAKQSGRQIMELLRRDITPRQILTREALLNGVAGVMAAGSSTSLMLHLLTIAHEAGVELTLNDFDRISREVPFVCNLQPSGKYPIVSMDACGGIPAVLKNVEPKLHRDVMTVAGKTLGQMLDAAEPAENDVIRITEHPQKPEGGIAVLCRSLTPDGAVVKQSGVEPSMYRFSGRARMFNSTEEADAAVSAGIIEKGTVLVIRYEGPKRGPGMREMLSTTALIMGRGTDEDCALVTGGRFSSAIHGPCIGHIPPEAVAGDPIALVEDGDEVFIDIAARRLELKVSPEELERCRVVQRPLVKPRGPALAKYATHISSADRGAIIELERQRLSVSGFSLRPEPRRNPWVPAGFLFLFGFSYMRDASGVQKRLRDQPYRYLYGLTADMPSVEQIKSAEVQA